MLALEIWLLMDMHLTWEGIRITQLGSSEDGTSVYLENSFLSDFVTLELEGGALHLGGTDAFFADTTFYRCCNIGSGAVGGVCYLDVQHFNLARCCAYGCSSGEGQFAYLIGERSKVMSGSQVTFLTWGPGPGLGLTQSAGIVFSHTESDLSSVNFTSCSLSGESAAVAHDASTTTFCFSYSLVSECRGVSIITGQTQNGAIIEECGFLDNSLEPGGVLMKFQSHVDFESCRFRGVLSVSVPSGRLATFDSCFFVESAPGFGEGSGNVVVDELPAVSITVFDTWFCPIGTMPPLLQPRTQSPTAEFSRPIQIRRRRFFVEVSFFVVALRL
jgi:hypothetical protein